ncbi:MAG: Asp-tRNA(Asn)/Glu-tRNA(Gln) amidotransferase subunit GatC [Clostridia bacterium]|nr:Asp-tRNA(Asn)/Glu-tRNA(Gln) amidotransferase subunit GatC [Clostridia bacterium]
MEITNELVNYLEKLGRIELDDEQKIKTKKDLQDILSYIDTLNELDTDNVEPLSHSFPVFNVFHEDVVENGDMREDILKNAPDSSEGCFKVHRTVE